MSSALSCAVTARPTVMLELIATVWAVPWVVQVIAVGRPLAGDTSPTRVIRTQ